MKNTINVERVVKRGDALLDSYLACTKKSLPELSVFVKDYFAITDAQKTNRSFITQTIEVLKKVYDSKMRTKGLNVLILFELE